MADMGWSRHIENEEHKAVGACVSTAIKNGHTKEKANKCDAGSVGCPDCPFRPAVTPFGFVDE